MDLGKVAARLRLRNGYEAVDLGFLLARRFAWPMYAASMVCVFPFVALAIAFCALTQMFWLPFVLLWWAKPLYTRVPLHILSRCFFGDVPTPKQTAKAMPGYWFKPFMLLEMTLFRFNVLRGFSIFVKDLEGANYSTTRQRLKVLLNERTKQPANWLYLTSYAMELVIFTAFIVLLAITLPESLDFDLFDGLIDLFDEDVSEPWLESFVIGAYGLSIMLVEPLLVAGNFGLYISRRVELEGWDIELAFRKLAARLEETSSRALDKVALWLVSFGLIGALMAPAPAFAEGSNEIYEGHADDEQSQEVIYVVPKGDPKQIITEILEDPIFGEEGTVKRWELRERFQRTSKGPRNLGAWVQLIATTLKVLLWIAAITGLAFLLVVLVRRAMRHFEIFEGRISHRPEWEQSVALVEEESTDGYVLPDDIVAHARRAWAEGDELRALNLLYLGTLEVLEARHGVGLDPGMTAYECVRIVRRVGGPHELVSAVARAWTALVFARRRPSDAEVEALFDRWQATFGPGRTP